MITRLLTTCCLSAYFLSPLAQAKLSKEDAQLALKQLTTERKATLQKERAAELKAKVITHGDKSMRFEFKEFGDVPEGGHSLYISMHGGGSAPARVNDQQWRNQINLYQPKEGFYLAPRAATNTWNLWHEAHIDPMFDRIIENFVALKGVNPNKVYVTGYSAGGDGTYQLAPRMADRWAAAAMMAGHPNEARPDNLINLPFFTQCGAKDAMYKRNTIAKEWGEKLDKLEAKHPGLYPHKTIIHQGMGHWMNRKDAVAIPWMAKYARNPWPKQIVWYQDDVTSKRLYWLGNDNPQKGQRIEASVEGQTITLTTDNVPTVTLRLSDQLLDLDQPITVVDSSAKVLFQGKVERTEAALKQSLDERFDPTTAASALLSVKLH